MAARQQSRNYFEALARSSSDVESSSDDKAPAESMRKAQHSARCGMHCGRPVRNLRLVDTLVAMSEYHLPAEPQRTYWFYHIYMPAHSL